MKPYVFCIMCVPVCIYIYIYIYEKIALAYPEIY